MDVTPTMPMLMDAIGRRVGLWIDRGDWQMARRAWDDSFEWIQYWLQERPTTIGMDDDLSMILSEDLYGPLSNCGIRTVRHCCSVSRESLLAAKGIGIKAVADIEWIALIHGQIIHWRE